MGVFYITCAALFPIVSIATSSLFVPSTPLNSIAFKTSETMIAVASTGGKLTFYDVGAPQSGLLQSFDETGEIFFLSWNRFIWDVLAVVTSDRRIIVRKFADAQALTSFQSVLIKHPLPVTCADFDLTTGTALAVGSSAGFVDLYTVSFDNVVGVSHIALNAESDRSHRWYLGCHVSFIWWLSATDLVAGCADGTVKFLGTSQTVPSSTINFETPLPVPYSTTLFKVTPSNSHLVAYFNGRMHITNLSTRQQVPAFEIRPFRSPKTQYRKDSPVLGLDANNEVVVLRSHDGVIVYDLSGLVAGTVATTRWINDLTLTDLLTTQGASFAWSVVRTAVNDNIPFVNVNKTAGTIEFFACWPNAARADQIGDLRDVSCGPEPPVITLEITLPFSISAIKGEFSVRSVGKLPAHDCSALKGPIAEWGSEQSSQWLRVTPADTSNYAVTSCPTVSDTPQNIQISTVDACKAACTNRPECNMVYVKKFKDSAEIEICTFHRCQDPSVVPRPGSAEEEVWTVTTPSRFWKLDKTKFLENFGGYVAFGTMDTVIYGGCQSANGLIAMGSAQVVTVPQTNTGDSSVIRFQVSQYNAEAVVRIEALKLDIYMDYAPFSKYIEEPISPPGGYMVPEGGSLNGGPRGPIALIPAGTAVITTLADRSIGSINIS